MDLHGDHARCVRRQFGARVAHRFLHLAQDMQTAVLGTGQRHLHDFLGDALDLDVHLQRGDAVVGTGHLEVHVAEVVLVTGMSVSTANLLPSRIRPMATPATWALTGTPASISAAAAARTEAIEEEPFDSVISDTGRMV